MFMNCKAKPCLAIFSALFCLVCPSPLFSNDAAVASDKATIVSSSAGNSTANSTVVENSPTRHIWENRELELSALISFDYSKPGDNRQLFQSGNFHHGNNQTLHPGRFELQLSSPFNEKTRFFSQIDFNFTDRENDNQLKIALGYLRFENVNNRSFSLDIGRIPNPIGLFPARKSAFENPLHGRPLIYDYRSSLRNDSFPKDADELAARKMGGNNLETFTRNFIADGITNSTDKKGLPVLSSENPLGIAFQTRKAGLDYTLAFTNNSPINAEAYAINNEPNVILRVDWSDFRYTRLAFNYSSGKWLDKRIEQIGVPLADKCKQTLNGLSLQYKRNSLEVLSEIMLSNLETPFQENLKTLGHYLELKHFFHPRLYGAIRQEGLDFKDIQTSAGKVSWDENIKRSEFGVGHYIDESTLSKMFYQINKHQNNDPDDNLWGLELSASF